MYKTKYNKHNSSWGIWATHLGGSWLIRLVDGQETPYKFQSKQEAQKFINKNS